jgi:hypothetical protein
VYSVPFFPAICVEVGAAAVVAGDIATAEDDVADEDDEAVELVELLALSFW